MKTTESMNKKTYCVPAITLVRLDAQATLLQGSYTEKTDDDTPVQDGGSFRAPRYHGVWDNYEEN